MKKFIVFTMALIFLIGFAGMAFAGVVGSAHDLSATTVATDTGSAQVCVYCHHPHRGVAAGVPDELIWNLDDSIASFPTYTSPTMDSAGAGTAVTATAPASYACMACHDGSIGIGALVQLPGDATQNLTVAFAVGSTNPAANLGATLVDDHPVNFTYPLADAGIKAPVGQVVTGASAATYPLFSDLMQCGTCHDVHAGGADSASTAIDFMRGDTAASVICTDCHINK